MYFDFWEWNSRKSHVDALDAHTLRVYEKKEGKLLHNKQMNYKPMA